MEFPKRKNPSVSTQNVKPATNDKMLRQAIYNTGAIVVVVLAGFGIVALYWVLESFFRSLMWAILCGAFLHPFKYRVTKNIKSWLSGLKTSRTPITIGVMIVPFNILDITSESIVQSIKKRFRVILVVLSVFTTLYIMYLQAPMDFRQFTAFIWSLFITVSNIISFFSFKWVCALIIGYLIIVVRFWSEDNKKMFSYLAIPLWLLTLLCTIASSGALRLPLALAIIVFIAIGIYTDLKDKKDASKDAGSVHLHLSDDVEEPSSQADGVSLSQQFHSFSNFLMTSFTSSTPHSTTVNTLSYSNLEDNAANDDDGANDSKSSTLEGADVAFEEEKSSPSEDVKPAAAAAAAERHDETLTSRDESSNEESLSPSKFNYYKQRSSESKTEHNERMRRRSDKCFIFLFWAIVLVILWSNVRLILLPLIAVLIYFFKKSVIYVKRYISEHYQERFTEHLRPVEAWCKERLEVIVPAPIRQMICIVIRGDSKLIDILLQSADSFITIALILLLLVGFVVLSIAVCFQVQKEGIHLVTVTSNLVQNSTLRPQWLTDLLPNGDDNETAGIHSSLDPMIKNVYSFGREWIVDQISQRVTHQTSRKLLETELIGIWDSLYDSWVTKNTTRIAKPNYNGALFSHIKNGGVDFMWQNISVNMTGIINFVRENIGLFQSVMESIWILLKGNINLAFTLLITLLQMILGGGTAILNSIVSLVVFFTTLFYLLASSSNDYKPVEWISRLTIAKSGGKFAQAVEDGIGGVFAATLKLAAFYGVYTWLTHTVFGINIVFLPSIFAAIFGAIPFVGTYWAALPAVLELCLIHKEVFLGLLLAGFHLLPTFVVDIALYSDIKGGGHPYLTGLAIAGGIYCFGLQGAIIGPVLLCCIIVAMNLYSAVINPDQPITPLTPGSQTILSQAESNPALQSTGRLRRCLSSYDL